MSENPQQPDEDGAGPEISPYASPLLRVSFQDGKPLQIPEQLLKKYPDLLADIEDRHYQYEPTFLPLSSNVGHVLVHFVYTGKYQCLRPKGAPVGQRSASELAIALKVCSLAEEYYMPSLGRLAQAEVCTLGNDLSLSSLISIIEKGDCISIHNTWVAGYMKLRVKSFCRDVRSKAVKEPLEELDTFPPTTTKLVLQSVAELLVSELSCKDEPNEARKASGDQSEVGRHGQADTSEVVAKFPIRPAADLRSIHEQVPSDFVFPKLDTMNGPREESSEPRGSRASDLVAPRANRHDNSKSMKQLKKEKKQARKTKKKMRVLPMVEEPLEGASDSVGDLEDDLSVIATPSHDSFGSWDGYEDMY
ncbi:hypothetical protein QQZ08_010955 [Neonectria magnoliae]|uniref:BTB domain-containing protein n=1 Tax=Neonectria magnoliae TaxID=2732573 RepID=A0ABR1HDF4_9HYPO